MACVNVRMCTSYVCVYFYLFIDIQHAPLHSNTTRFRLKYSQYGYIYLPIMYNIFCFLYLQQVYFRFSTLVTIDFFYLLSTALLNN